MCLSHNGSIAAGSRAFSHLLSSPVLPVGWTFRPFFKSKNLLLNVFCVVFQFFSFWALPQANSKVKLTFERFCVVFFSFFLLFDFF